VFLHPGLVRVRDGRLVGDDSDRPFFLLGLMHGHWDALEAEVDAPFLSPVVEKMNMGIGIVVPIDEILRTFGAILDGYVAEAAGLLDEAQEPTADTPLSVANEEFERFEDLTGKLLRVPRKSLTTSSRSPSAAARACCRVDAFGEPADVLRPATSGDKNRDHAGLV
jgi:hypothetical protein